MRQMLAHLPFFVVSADRDRHFTWVNRLDPTLTESDVMGRRVDDFVHPESLPAVIATIERAFETGEVQTYEARAYGGGETATWYGTRVVPLPVDAEGRERVLLLSNEITGRKNAQESLRTSERRFRLLTESFPDAILVVDAQLQIRYLNRDPRPEVASDRQELDGRPVSDFIHPDDAPVAVARIRRVLETREASEYEARSADGQRHFIARVLPFDDHGDGRVLISAADVTEHRRAEAEHAALQARLQQAQRMESVGELAGGVAHDFNNLLLVIRAHLELARLGVGELANELEGIDAAVERAQELTSRLLAVARRQPNRPRRVDLRTLIERTGQLLERVIPESVRLELELGDEPLWAHVDPSHVEQVLLNLCNNARDAIEGTGTIRVRAGRRDRDEDGARLVVSVEDTGAGMDTATLTRAFEPFFTTKPAGRGTGLGLSMVHGLIASNGGEVSAKSEPGQGTTITVTLPEAPSDVPAERPAPARSRTPMAGGSETILVAEDEPMVREVVRRLLEGAGYEVIEAEDGRAAVEGFRAHQERIDLVLLDAVMPALTGKDVYDQIIEVCPEMRVVFTSGYAAGVLDSQWLEAQGIAVVSKPYRAATLLDAIRRALDAR